MKMNALLSITGRQTYPGQEPDVIELVTDGTVEQRTDGCWELCYQESDLTGLEGVTTSFLIEPGRITLTRKGRLRSQMVFQEGVRHDSLYQMEFGALMMAVCANKVDYQLSEEGGTVDLLYTIEIEQTMAGFVDYHLNIKVKEE